MTDEARPVLMSRVIAEQLASTSHPQHHRSGSSAAGEPQATLSRTGLRAYTATDWGGSIGELVLEAA